MRWLGQNSPNGPLGICGRAGLFGLLALMSSCAHLPDLPCNSTRTIYALTFLKANEAAVVTKIVEQRICDENIRTD